MRLIRNLIVLATFVLATLDLFQYFIVVSDQWFMAGRLIFLALGVSLATAGGTLIAHAILSLWEGTSFVRGIIDYEPDTTSANRW